MKLLLVKTSSMGDVVHTMPAVTEALAARPDLLIDWMVERPFMPIAKLHPGVGTIHPVETRRWRKALFSRGTWAEIGALKRGLRAARYDLVLDAQGLMKSAVLARLAGPPIHGMDRASAREGIASSFYTASHAVPRDMHAIDRTRMLFAQALGYRTEGDGSDFGLTVPAGDGSYSDAAFLLHGTSWESKKWPVGNWVALGNALLAEGLRPVTTWGNEDERTVAEAIARALPRTEILPRTTLDAVAAVLGEARLVVGVDTGLTHLAAALARPTVAIFIASRPGLTGPRGRRIAIVDGGGTDGLSPVSRRDKPAGTAVTPDQALEAARDLLRAG